MSKVKRDQNGYPVIRIPKYLVGLRDLNEYELRELQAMVADGEIRGPIKVMDMEEKVEWIGVDGALTGSLAGMSWTVESTMRLLRAQSKIDLKLKGK